MTKKIIVAIDGLSSCGKSTMARELAREVGYAYIDTGAMYRAVTLYALRHALLSPDGAVDAAALERRMDEIDITFRVNPATGRSETHLNGQNVEADIRGMEVSALVSRVSALPFVRRALVAQQQAMGREKGLVMDGRDIGTVVFPQAELKVFVTASDEVRAQRRVDGGGAPKRARARPPRHGARREPPAPRRGRHRVRQHPPDDRGAA